MNLLNLIFTETSLELVPREILLHPSVRRNAKRRKKPPQETLLDRSLHHYAMNKLPNAEKRGRPDIIHFCLLLAMGSPLNQMGKLNMEINTINDLRIKIDPLTRPPRDCLRFNSLMEQLLVNGAVPSKGEPLMKLYKESLEEQMKIIDPSKIIALSSYGEQSTFMQVAKILSSEDSPAVFIGAYPSGPMKSEILEMSDHIYSVHSRSLEAWTVTSRIIYEYEKLMSD
jgi:rRNA small subunit pseudouridine methyltransferase Nep1